MTDEMATGLSVLLVEDNEIDVEVTKRVLARAGQRVAPGTSLVVLEAMKMENELKAAAPGVVAQVAVTPGQTVEKGEILVTFADGAT